MVAVSIKDRKPEFDAVDLIVRKKFNLPSGTLSAERSSNKYNSAESLTTKYKLSGTKSK